MAGLRHIDELTERSRIGTPTATLHATCVAELRRFEIELGRHFLLEDHVLFPKAIALEPSASRTV